MDGPNNAAHGRLKSLVERIERLEEDKKAVTADLGEVFAEAKGEGFDTKILRKVIRLRAQDPAKRAEEEALIDLYLGALGVPRSEPVAPRPPPPTPLEDAIAAAPADKAPEPPPAPDTKEEAAAKGAAAAKTQQPITANPYGGGTAQRRAWDEAWCKESGSDGMDIPDAWKPDKGQKPGGKKK